MRLACVLICVLVLMFPAFLHAQMYGYVDKDGVFHFTDSITDIPEDQRPGADYIDVPERQAKRTRLDAKGEMEKAPNDQEVDAVSVNDSDSSFPVAETEIKEMRQLSELNRLNKLKADLDAEYAALVREKQSLVDRGKALTTAFDIEAYNSEMKDLNARISAFEEKRQAFKKELDAFYTHTGP